MSDHKTSYCIFPFVANIMYLEISWFIQSQRKYITDDPLFRMRRYNKALLLLIPVISAAIFLTGHIAFASGEQSISESTSIQCTGGSCYKVSCINGQCQTFSYNQPSSEQLAGEATATIMQPAEEAPTMRSADETSDMQTIDDATEQYIEVPVEFCDDGLDNDDDGKVDEECGATTFSSASPDDLIGEEDHKQQSIDGLEQPIEENEHSADESEEYESNNEASEEEEHGHED